MSGDSGDSKSSSSSQLLTVRVEFSGGAELLFDNVKNARVELPEPATVSSLLSHIADNLLSKERPELFFKDGTVRPGILVLVNDADWELLGKEGCELEDGDTVTFISTLHGG